MDELDKFILFNALEDEREEELYFINYGIKYRMGDELMEQREES